MLLTAFPFESLTESSHLSQYTQSRVGLESRVSRESPVSIIYMCVDFFCRVREFISPDRDDARIQVAAYHLWVQ